LQVAQAITPDKRVARKEFAVTTLEKLDEDNEFLRKIVFFDEATFHVSGKVNKQNVRIWGSEHPRATVEHITDSLRVNEWCCLLHDRLIGPFFFAEVTVISSIYLNMLENFVYPQLQDLQPAVLFQQDGAPPHWRFVVRASLNQHFPNRWIGRAGPISWPARSPDITPCNFFLWGYVKDCVYRNPVADINDSKERIKAAIATVDVDMLQRTWMELEYGLDIVRVTNGAHV
jgi:hypothetical protein